MVYALGACTKDLFTWFILCISLVKVCIAYQRNILAFPMHLTWVNKLLLFSKLIQCHLKGWFMVSILVRGGECDNNKYNRLPGYLRAF